MSLATKVLSLLLGALMLLSLCSLVATVHVAAQPGTGTWTNQTLDGGTGVGIDSSIAIDSHGYMHISYGVTWPNYGLKYAWQDAAGWHNITVDYGRYGYWIGGHTSLALDGNGYPHISYYGDVMDAGGYLLYVYQDASGWHQPMTVDSAGDAPTSLALDGNGYPHISYFGDYPNDYLMYAWQDASGWHYSTADSATSLGDRSSLALDGNGYPHISYSDYYNRALKYAWQDADGWHNTTLDSTNDGGASSSIALDASGYPRIGYAGWQGTLKYAWQDASGWHNTTVNSQWNVGYWTSIALDSLGFAHISSDDAWNGHLMYASQDATGWYNTTVDSGPYVGYATSLALDASGYPHISYSYANYPEYALKYAYWTPPSSTLAATASPTSVAVNRPFWVTGTLNTPNGVLTTKAGAPIAGATVQLQKNVGGTWQNVPGKTTTTGATGAYRISTSETAAGTYQYRTTYAGSPTHASATSGVVTVTITAIPPGPSLTPKGR